VNPDCTRWKLKSKLWLPERALRSSYGVRASKHRKGEQFVEAQKRLKWTVEQQQQAPTKSQSEASHSGEGTVYSVPFSTDIQ
jgi:hypothetical protein